MAVTGMKSELLDLREIKHPVVIKPFALDKKCPFMTYPFTLGTAASTESLAVTKVRWQEQQDLEKKLIPTIAYK